MRQNVFVVERNCVYLDADDLDRRGLHLLGWEGEGRERELVAYCRILPLGLSFQEPSIGRVLTTPGWRGRGLGKELMKRSIAKITESYPNHPIHISAQSYLEHFYASFGFQRNSDPYDEDGIPHIEMLRAPM